MSAALLIHVVLIIFIEAWAKHTGLGGHTMSTTTDCK